MHKFLLCSVVPCAPGISHRMACKPGKAFCLWLASKPTCSGTMRAAQALRPSASGGGGLRMSALSKNYHAQADLREDANQNIELGGGRERPLLSMGILSDIQYADIADGTSHGGTPRYYRHALAATEMAVNSWIKNKNVSLVVNMGDLIDGKQPKNTAVEALGVFSRVFERFGTAKQELLGSASDASKADAPASAWQGNGTPPKTVHVVGNHCLYNFRRDTLIKALGLSDVVPKEEEEAGCIYYSLAPVAGVRVVVLDGYDISCLWGTDTRKGRLANSMLAAGRRDCEDKNTNSPGGMKGPARRWVAFNGAVGARQVAWLQNVLSSARRENERVIILSHNPLHFESSAPQCLLWNYQEILDILASYRDCVAVCLAGHGHAGGFSRDDAGIPHRVLEAIVECPPGTSAYGILHVYVDRVEIEGFGGMRSQVMYSADSLEEMSRACKIASEEVVQLIKEQRRSWRQPHGHNLSGGMSEEERQRLQKLERTRAKI